MFRKPAPSSSKPTAPSTAVTITESAPCEQSLQLQVPSAEIAPVRGTVLGEFQRQATLPGFRKGKAPEELIERQYAKEIEEETRHRVIKQTLERVVKQRGLKPIGPFEVRRATLGADGALSLEAVVEVEPAFPLAGYKGIPLTSKPVEVTAQEIEQALASLQGSMAELAPAGEGQPKERTLPPIDDELAKDLGFETLEKLRSHVEAKLREQKRAAQAQAMEASACDELLHRHIFALPARLVEHQT